MSRNVKRASEENSAVSAKRLSELVHDIRHCLHVLRIGRELLITLDDAEKRREVCQSMALEEEKATALLDELVAIARGRIAQNHET
jgi:hypothetical protein